MKAQPWLGRAAAAIEAGIGLFLFAATAGAADCPDAVPPQVRLGPLPSEVRQDFSKSSAELNRIAKSANPEQADRYADVLGISVADVTYKVEVSASLSENGDGTFCAALVSLTVGLGFVDRVVYVARETDSDDCAREQILQHEMKHVRRDDAALGSFIGAVAGRFRELVSALKRTPERTADEAQRKLLKEVDAVAARAARTLARGRSKLQAEIDSPEEIDRLTNACDGRIKRLLDAPAERDG